MFLYASASHLDTFLNEAGRAEVQHIVLLPSFAVLSPDAETSSLARSHLDAERAVQASPITATILRPGLFATNATGQPITVEQVTPTQWKDAVAEQLPPHFADSLLDCWKSTDGKPVPLIDTVHQLTGHPGRTFGPWAAHHTSDFIS